MLGLVLIVPLSSGLYGEVSQIIRDSGSPTGASIVLVAYKKSSLNAKGELLYLTVCDDDDYDHHHHYENNTDIDIFVNCNWVNTRWQWFVHIYTQKLRRII
jgi:hypothetical protein